MTGCDDDTPVSGHGFTKQPCSSCRGGRCGRSRTHGRGHSEIPSDTSAESSHNEDSQCNFEANPVHRMMASFLTSSHGCSPLR